MEHEAKMLASNCISETKVDDSKNDFIRQNRETSVRENSVVVIGRSAERGVGG